jgi:death-on-curing protein
MDLLFVHAKGLPIMPYVYLTEQEITNINREMGGVATINAGALTAAADGPSMGFGGHDLFPTLPEKAAKLIWELSQAHPFNDANKRTASEALERFIKANRGGRGIVGGKGKAMYLVNQCADEHPAVTMAGGLLAVALGKLIPAAAANEPA